MEFLSVIAAAIATFAFGAGYYMLLAKPWMAASGVEVGEDGQPADGNNPMPYIVAFVMIIIVAGMMRHNFAAAGIDTASKGLVSGFGVGAFFITPWMFINAGYEGKPWTLPLINGGYAAFGCAVMGFVLTLF
jgi:hypothetical protein